MQIEALADASAIAPRAADIVAAVVSEHPAARVGLPTGRTPIATYAELGRRDAARSIDLGAVTGYAIDEFAGVSAHTPGTNAYFYRQHVRFRLKALHCPMSGARYPDVHIAAFGEGIRFAGGLDLCILGVGVNGHIAFNEPGSAVDSQARVVELTRQSREAHADDFGSLERVPARGMTLGIANILESRKIVVLATGADKAEAVRAATEERPSAETPASWLQGHADVTWLLDQPAASLLAHVSDG